VRRTLSNVVVAFGVVSALGVVTLTRLQGHLDSPGGMLLGAAVVTAGGAVVRPWLDDENASMVLRQLGLGATLVLGGLYLIFTSL
jgi:hypothetical protein